MKYIYSIGVNVNRGKAMREWDKVMKGLVYANKITIEEYWEERSQRILAIGKQAELVVKIYDWKKFRLIAREQVLVDGVSAEDIIKTSAFRTYIEKLPEKNAKKASIKFLLENRGGEVYMTNTQIEGVGNIHQLDDEVVKRGVSENEQSFNETKRAIRIIITKLYKPRKCLGCGIEFIPKRKDQTYHSYNCKCRFAMRIYRMKKKEKGLKL